MQTFLASRGQEIHSISGARDDWETQGTRGGKRGGSDRSDHAGANCNVKRLFPDHALATAVADFRTAGVGLTGTLLAGMGGDCSRRLPRP